METIKSLVRKLVQTESISKQVNVLQEINTLFLTKYMLEIIDSDSNSNFRLYPIVIFGFILLKLKLITTMKRISLILVSIKINYRRIVLANCIFIEQVKKKILHFYTIKEVLMYASLKIVIIILAF
ncbi:hypothetical protein EZS27_017560 [termite gut metagenome]|uniref:Uncharacterized protein n=1 Tax=termite gut metagenome TaxID=433724 RepID=A0A5J4RKJ5_9ZZZZ